MEKWITIVQVIAPIFFTVFLGVYARRKALFGSEEVQGFQRFVVKFCIPCLIFQSCLTADIGTQALSSVLLLPLLLLSTLWSFRRGRKKYPYSNLPLLFCCKETGMIGIPLFVILFGADQAYRMGILDVTQAMIVFPVMAILSVDVGTDASPKAIVKEMLKSPMIILSIIGLTLNLTGIWNALVAIGVGGIVTETLTFLSQPVSMVMLFCVGYNFSLAKDSRSVIFKIAGLHFAVFMGICLLVQGLLFLVPGADAMTRWAILLYCFLPASYLSPGLGRDETDFTVASGVCSVLTVVCLAAFCGMAILVS